MSNCKTCHSKDGTPGGCKNNGLCTSNGCNKLEVYDWLENMNSPMGESTKIIEVRFKNSRKSFYKNDKNIPLQSGDLVVVDVAPGYDVGVVSVTGELAKIQFQKRNPDGKEQEQKKIIRKANKEDIDKWIKARGLEKDLMFQSRVLAVNLDLKMKISDVEYQGDLSKATFFYTAEERVDFRQLIKDMADQFKIRIEMRQIGSRQESSKLGGIGSCGRELCCSTWLTDFRTVATSSARYQQLSLNPLKLAGQCGKLKCCLNYELDMYLEILKTFPSIETKLYTEKGTAFPVKTDLFKQIMWYMYNGESGLIALTPDRVQEIKKLNEKGIKPKDLLEFIEKKSIVDIPEYGNVVGQDSLNRFDKQFKNKKKHPNHSFNKTVENKEKNDVQAINPNQHNKNKKNNKNRNRNQNKPLNDNPNNEN
ncbi:MAG: hypothetical protein HYU67_08945 [Flavobacteriia bacterium]|nr:hypothetical protein [Flavobacteriia bacterium]